MSKTESEDNEKSISNHIKMNTDKSLGSCDSSSPEETVVSESDIKNKIKTRSRKRKRIENSSSSESEGILPDNTLEMEKNLHASALKNNLDELSVKKILKKVVTNDHVLALVKLREEEEEAEGYSTEEGVRPKQTRAKTKELMKVSPRSRKIWGAPLTPIKHIPIKTRPEVTALISQELPDDEDDDEYEPAHDDEPSDDDHTLESCSDVDSLPRTPATPRPSPRVVKDGPFKVPQELTTPTRRKLNLDEEATIALRTRSKLSLSETPIEHIESSFVPPDDVPTVDVDDPVWNEFLEECLNPAESNARNEDDDDADPEYNVAADPDSNDEDEALEDSIIKISQKEINDLMSELFSIMPEAMEDENGNNQNCVWEGKQEPLSDDETGSTQKSQTDKQKIIVNYSIGKNEPQDSPNTKEIGKTPKQQAKNGYDSKGRIQSLSEKAPSQPAVLQTMQVQQPTLLLIQVTSAPQLLPEQILIFQQQLRQHIQLATSNFLQLYAHPEKWSYAHHFKEYLVALNDIVATRPNSAANVCNLRPALELVQSWEKSVSEPTPENNEMVQFVKSQCDRSRNRNVCKSLYVGEFHGTLKEVISNSTVFLYPYLLPAMPYRDEVGKKFRFLRSEDELIALGLEQFWEYVEMNPKLFPTRKRGAHRFGLIASVRLLCRHMMPWCQPGSVMGHIHYVRMNDTENPINKFFKNRKVEPYKHKLLPFNPKLTLYEQPEYEMPRIWLRHLAKTSKRFRDYLYKRTNVTGILPQGVEVSIGKELTPVEKKAAEYIKYPTRLKSKTYIDQDDLEKSPPKEHRIIMDKIEIDTSGKQPTIIIHGGNEPSKTVNSFTQPICSIRESPQKSTAEDKNTENKILNEKNKPEVKSRDDSEHCRCCVLLRKICKVRQKLITDYFCPKLYKAADSCPCKSIYRPRMTNKLRLLLKYYKSRSMYVHKDMKLKYLLCNENRADLDYDNMPNASIMELDDLSDPHDSAAVTTFMLKLVMRLGLVRNTQVKKSVFLLFWKFDQTDGDVTQLVTSLEKLFDVELVDLFREFLRFLTPEQADKVGKFKDHFTQASASDLVKRISEEVTDKGKRKALLLRLIRYFTDAKSMPCDICSDLLKYMEDYQDLAKYTFNLFSHRSVRKKPQPTIPKEQSQAGEASNVPEEKSDQEETAVLSSNEEEVSLQYETDESSSSNNSQNIHDHDTETDGDRTPLKMEIDDDETNNRQIDEKPNKIENPPSRIRNDSEGSLKIELVLSDEESVKCEAPEWQRSEDKLILEIIKYRLTRKERQNKTILEILEDKEVMQMITDSLSHKSTKEVTDRVMYLIELLLLSEK